MASKIARENAAANAVVDHLTSLTGVTMSGRKWDDGTANGMHDFYIEGESHRIALEVTTIADGNRVGRDHRWARRAPGGWVKVDGLVGCWIAHQEDGIEATPVISALNSNLPALETLGISRVDAYLWREHALSPVALRPPGYEQSQALDRVGITAASRITDASEALRNAHAGDVQVVRGFGVHRPADRNFPATFVGQQLRGAHHSDVQKLLAVGDATTRHIWMWVELAEGLAMIRSLEVEGLPAVDLDVEGIDGVWLGRSPVPDTVGGHLWLRGHGWSEFSVARNEANIG